MQAMWATGLGIWNGPVNLHASANFSPGGQISVAKHGNANNTLDVFAKSNIGPIQFMRVVGLGAWSGPTTVPNASGQQIDSLITATANRGTTQLDLLAIGSNGLSFASSNNGSSSYSSFSKLP